MANKTLYIFTASHCVNCGPLKDNLRRLNIDFKEIDIDEDEGASKAAFFGVRSLPTALIEGPDGETLFLRAGTGVLDSVREIMQDQ